MQDVHVESDLELMFPVTYIPNDAERIAIYRELDNITGEMETLEFTRRLEDRFGRIPTQGRELIRIVRLRRLAQTVGVEKVVLKNGQMALHLVADPESPFYQSPRSINSELRAELPRRCLFRETGKRRSLVIRHVESVEARRDSRRGEYAKVQRN